MRRYLRSFVTEIRSNKYDIHTSTNPRTMPLCHVQAFPQPWYDLRAVMTYAFPELPVRWHRSTHMRWDIQVEGLQVEGDGCFEVQGDRVRGRGNRAAKRVVGGDESDLAARSSIFRLRPADGPPPTYPPPVTQTKLKHSLDIPSHQAEPLGTLREVTMSAVTTHCRQTRRSHKRIL